MQRCPKCDWGQGLCADRKACGHRQAALTPNQKAKLQGRTREDYHDRQVAKAKAEYYGLLDIQ